MLPKAPRFPTTQNQPNQPFSPAGQKEARPELLCIRQESGLQMPGLARAPIISPGAEKAENSLPGKDKGRCQSPLERQGPAPGTAALPVRSPFGHHPGTPHSPWRAHSKTQATLGFHTHQLQHGTQEREQKPTHPAGRWGGGLKKHCQIHIASRHPAPDEGTPSRKPREVHTTTNSRLLLRPVS